MIPDDDYIITNYELFLIYFVECFVPTIIITAKKWTGSGW